MSTALAYAERAVQRAQQARHRIFRNGVNPQGKPVWTAREMSIVQRLYPDYQAIQRELPHRSYSAIRGFAQNYKIASKRHVWTTQEVARLRQLYARATRAELIEAFPGLTINQIVGQARFRGFQREKTGPKPLGIPILDAIRRRAFELNYSLTDLDAECRSKKYFQKATRSIIWKYVQRAIEYLEGVAVVRWQD